MDDMLSLLDSADPETLRMMLQALNSGETMGMGQQMFQTPGAEGRNVGHTYVAASPIEHMGNALQRVMGARMIQQGQGQRGGGIEAYINALRGRQPQFDPARAASLSGFDDPLNYG